jgi:hypothetical protein
MNTRKHSHGNEYRQQKKSCRFYATAVNTPLYERDNNIGESVFMWSAPSKRMEQ